MTHYVVDSITGRAVRLTDEVKRLRAKRDMAVAQLKAAEERVDKLMGTEPAVGSIVVFEKTFPSTVRKTYTYVACRTNGSDRWYLTMRPIPLTWAQLREFMGLDTPYRVGSVDMLPTITPGNPEVRAAKPPRGTALGDAAEPFMTGVVSEGAVRWLRSLGGEPAERFVVITSPRACEVFDQRAQKAVRRWSRRLGGHARAVNSAATMNANAAGNPTYTPTTRTMED